MKHSRAENLLAFRYAEQLQQLANMGFLNEEINIDLPKILRINKYTPNVFPVIEELLAYQYMPFYSDGLF